MYPDYISAINRLDYNVGRLVQKLKDLGIYDDTVIIYSSDHGSHFKTRNLEYKRSCHDSSVHIPLVAGGPGFQGGHAVRESLADSGVFRRGIAGLLYLGRHQCI